MRMTIAILQNAALILALAFLYDVVVLSRVTGSTSRVRATLADAGTGVVLGLVGVAVMASSWELRDGVILDTRSVVLTIVGLFFGAVPVVLAMAITGGYRLGTGGVGAWTGLSVIIATGAVGLGARRVVGPDLTRMRAWQLAVIGLVAHVVMLAMFVLVPFEGSTEVLREIALPVLIVYPTAVVLVGMLLVRRRRDAMTARQLAESESRYRSVFDNEHLAVMVIDPASGNILEANQRAVDYYGWPRDELLSMTTSDIEVLPREQVRRRIDEGIAAGRTAFEFEHRLASGETRDVEVIGGAVTVDGEQRVHVVINDITDRKRAERDLATAQTHLRQAQKLEAVGRLAGGIAHDFNNMLQVILGYTEVARADADPESELAEHLDEIHMAARRSADLTQQLLAFARRQAADPRLVDVGAAIEASLRRLRRLVGHHVEVRVERADDPWLVRVDTGQFDQVITNLAINARDAMSANPSGAGRLSITVTNVVVDEMSVDDPPEASVGEFVEIAVRDDGHGMTPDVVASMFDPFFTTRSDEGGTGLGLAIVYGVITGHGGFIRVDTEPGVGTEFRLYLPRAQAALGEEVAEWVGHETGEIPVPDGARPQPE